MYEYKKTTSLAKLELPYGVDVKLDTLPLKSPFVPRICDKQAHMFIWWGTKETDPDIYEQTLKNKNEEQWITCDEMWKLEKGVASIHIYDTEIIIGCVKYSGVLKNRTIPERKKFIKQMWNDIVNIFKNKKIIVPVGSYLEYISLSMNLTKIQHEPYQKRFLNPLGFKKQGNFWIKNLEIN
jgi:hypothetical protein